MHTCSLHFRIQNFKIRKEFYYLPKKFLKNLPEKIPKKRVPKRKFQKTLQTNYKRILKKESLENSKKGSKKFPKIYKFKMVNIDYVPMVSRLPHLWPGGLQQIATICQRVI